MTIKTYYSQFGEDAWIDRHIVLPGRGIYADIGAAHPDHFSNTQFLRDRGWNGVAVDANAAYAPEWKSPFITAVVSSKDRVGFLFDIDPLMSKIVPDASGDEGLPCRTLESILNESKIEKLDFLSLDVEGNEFDAFSTMDLWRHMPTIIVAEFYTHLVGCDMRLCEHLCSSGLYRGVHQTQCNIIYAHKDAIMK